MKGKKKKFVPFTPQKKPIRWWGIIFCLVAWISLVLFVYIITPPIPESQLALVANVYIEEFPPFNEYLFLQDGSKLTKYEFVANGTTYYVNSRAHKLETCAIYELAENKECVTLIINKESGKGTTNSPIHAIGLYTKDEVYFSAKNVLSSRIGALLFSIVFGGIVFLVCIYFMLCRPLIYNYRLKKFKEERRRRRRQKRI